MRLAMGVKMYQKHDERYFAMLNNAVAIKDTSLEGGEDSQAFDYYDYLVNNPQDCPIDFDIDINKIKAVEEGISKLIAINHLIDDNYKKLPSIPRKPSTR